MTKASHDVTAYLSQPCLAEDANPLTLWNGNQTSFPELAQLACKYLAIPVFPVPVDRIVCETVRMLRPECGNLNNKTLEDLL